MTDEIKPEAEQPKPEQALAVLNDLMHKGESETSRLNAAKTILQQLAPEKDDKDDEEQKQAAEQARALAEAHRLLDDLVDQIHQANNQSRKMAASSEDEPDNTAG